MRSAAKLFYRLFRQRMDWRRCRRREKQIAGDGSLDWKSIPVIINNRNRLTYLVSLLSWLDRVGMHRILILDNDSTYPPLLDYYRSCTRQVWYLGRNLGHRALWLSEVFFQFRDGYYVYTDPDVVPDNQCPSDAVGFFLDTLSEYPNAAKVGFGLRIDDIPECYADKSDVLLWEKRHWMSPVSDHLYEAQIDTTFALYRPWVRWGMCLRTGFPYLARHLPWYIDSSSLSEEEVFYRAKIKSGTSWWTGECPTRTRLISGLRGPRQDPS